MKKLLAVAAVTLMTGSAFANTHMVRMYGWDSGARNNSFDFNTYSDDTANEVTARNIALNYAYAITGSIQVGATFKNYQRTSDSDVQAGSFQTLGLSGYYNFAGQTVDTTYVGLHFDATTFADDATTNSRDGEEQTDIILEAGHRFSVGTGWGFNLNYAPSVLYTMNTTTPDGGDDTKTNTLTWNFLKFDVLF